MELKPLLSVIVVAFRSSGEIRDCVQSIPTSLTTSAGRGAVEVLVVDNSLNSDGTEQVLAEFSHVQYVRPPENLGFGKANNLGFARTSGEFVLFLNPDTVCSERALVHCLERVQREEDVGMISPRLVLADGTMDLACRRSVPSLWDGFCRGSGLAARFPRCRLFAGYNLTYLDDSGTYDVGAINGAFMMGRRKVFEEVVESRPAGVFDEKFFMYGDDLDLCIRVANAGYRVVYDGRVQITHLKGTSVAKDYDRMSQAIFDANRDVFLKHYNPRGSWLASAKYRLAFGLWKRVVRWRARVDGRRTVQPH